MAKSKKPILEKTTSTPTMEKVVLKQDTFIGNKLYKQGAEIAVTDEIKKLLKPFGYSF
ncbi:MAG: hypothetical protein LBG59_07900 [Candidatus Peribacteria bacterium]|jgi:hypothetical protein|nr:hypothetical protein [Candidatus Peribacteria bacterium]